jgi:hypothetical protein
LRLATIQSNQTADAIHQVHEQVSEALSRQAEQIEKLDQSLKSLKNEQQQLEEAASRLLEPHAASLANGGTGKAFLPSSILACVRKLAAATYAAQAFEVLVEEAARMNIRSAVFDVRGRAAWGSSAGGFGPELSEESLRTLVVPLNREGPFRQAFETAEAVETNAASLEANRNVQVKLAPAANARILLVPIRSAESVAAIFYADIGEKRDPALIDALKIVGEFAGAQIDRLMAVGGGLGAVEHVQGIEEAGKATEQADGDKAKAAESGAPASQVPELVTPEACPAEPPAPPPEVPQVSTTSPDEAQFAEERLARAEAADVAHTTEEEEKIHRDARRFSKLLVSEIELYNKSNVEEGRRNKDLYQRLKKDIDRSRETYEKRFARTVAKQVDYFHEELVRTLAENDPMLLGSGYPGPSV